VTQAAFESFTEEGINPGYVTLRQLTSIGKPTKQSQLNAHLVVADRFQVSSRQYGQSVKDDLILDLLFLPISTMESRVS